MQLDAGDPNAIDPDNVKRTEKHESATNLESLEVDIEEDGERHVVQRTTSSGSNLPMSKARTIALVATLTGAAFLNALSVQSAVIVLPSIGKDLSIPSARQQWIVSSYTLTFGCFLLLWGRLADVYGKRLIFIWGSAWVTVVAVATPFAPTEIGFDILRGLQGLGAAANVPTAIGILGVTFPPGKAKNYAFSFYSAGAPMGSVFGNLLGGVVSQYASWKWIFWILAVMAAAVTAAGLMIIPVPHIRVDVSAKDLSSKIDWIGGTLITISLLALMFALTEGNVVGWRTPWVPVLIVVSILLIAVFVIWQLYLEKRTTRSPLMKVTIFKNLKVSAANVVMLLFFASFNNFLVFATYFFQDYQGLSAIQTTLRFIPTGVVGLCTIFVTSQILARVSVNYMLMFGTSCVAISSLLFAIPIPPSTTYWAFGFPAMCLSVFGADTLYPSLMLLISHFLPREDQALGGALINAVGQIGRSLGLAIGTAIQVAVQERSQSAAESTLGHASSKGSDAFLRGIRAASWLDFVMALTGVVVAGVAFRGAGIVAKH
ncbi:hypothetical protein LTR50_001602 [Elasticomyces elasticus]|nr:hypothetical protein LTR50_001602 [Elasticomyces elasticus]